MVLSLSSKLLPVLGFMVLGGILFAPKGVYGSPFGQGVFGADVPFGSSTSLAINLGTDPSITLATDGPNTLSGTASHTVTVTSTDVVGYKLYAAAIGSSNMVNGANTIPASANTTPAALALNTWGYNTTGSTTNFSGLTTNQTQIKDADGPFKNGDATTITYGVRADITKPAGTYQVDVAYTAVAENQ